MLVSLLVLQQVVKLQLQVGQVYQYDQCGVFAIFGEHVSLRHGTLHL